MIEISRLIENICFPPRLDRIDGDNIQIHSHYEKEDPAINQFVVVTKLLYPKNQNTVPWLHQGIVRENYILYI